MRRIREQGYNGNWTNRYDVPENVKDCRTLAKRFLDAELVRVNNMYSTGMITGNEALVEYERITKEYKF